MSIHEDPLNEKTPILDLQVKPHQGMGEVLSEVLGVLAGYASLCWEPKPTGVFQSDKASPAVDEAIDFIMHEFTRRFPT